MLENYLLHITIISLLLVMYYKHTKLYIIKNTGRLVINLKLTRFFPASDIQGAIELLLIATSHVIFCVLLYLLIPTHLNKATINYSSQFSLIIYSILLGIGCMGASAMICQFLIKLIASIYPKENRDLSSWLIMSKGGWIKHHLQSLQLFPIYCSLFILSMQVGSEEIIFRVLVYHYFLPFGKPIALITATLFFILMQSFLMPRWQAAIFPMVGATVMGVTHSLLYQQIPVVWPLIISHITFFLFAVL